MTPQRDELKPCPFCGGKVILKWNGTWGEYFIKCESCNSMTLNSQHEDEAIKVWNTRPEPRIGVEVDKLLTDYLRFKGAPGMNASEAAALVKLIKAQTFSAPRLEGMTEARWHRLFQCCYKEAGEDMSKAVHAFIGIVSKNESAPRLVELNRDKVKEAIDGMDWDDVHDVIKNLSDKISDVIVAKFGHSPKVTLDEATEVSKEAWDNLKPLKFLRLPERIKPEEPEPYTFKDGWNSCLDEVARLNQDAKKVDVGRVEKIIDAHKIDEVMTIEIKTVSDIKEFFNQHLDKVKKAVVEEIYGGKE